ncbi:Neuropeptide Y receptor type 4 [Halotydeus destructor]|nr:Neuropeptide Y receptor type 4 [Halotydeus destructor]
MSGNASQPTQDTPNASDSSAEMTTEAIPQHQLSTSEQAKMQITTSLEFVQRTLWAIINPAPKTKQHLENVRESIKLVSQIYDYIDKSSGPESPDNQTTASTTEPLMPLAWEQRFAKLEEMVTAACSQRSYSQVAQQNVQRPIIQAPTAQLPQAVPTLTLKLDCLEDANLSANGLKQTIIDSIPARNGDAGVDRMRLLGQKSLLIVTRDEESKAYLEAQIKDKLKHICKIGQPFYKMPTVRIEGLQNSDSKEELKEHLDRKFPEYSDKIKVVLLHKIKSGNQQAAIVRVPKELYSKMMEEPELSIASLALDADGIFYEDSMLLNLPTSATYEINRISRLPPPYPSRCHYYNKRRCVVDCNFKEETKHSCTNALFYRRQLMKYCAIDLTACSRKCDMKEECHSVTYKLSRAELTAARSSMLNVLVSMRLTFLDLLPPRTETSVSETPCFTFTSFIIYVSGITGLWYGLSAQALKQIAIRLKSRHINALVSCLLVLSAVLHCIIESAAYFKYPTASLTTYESKDEIPNPKLSLRYALHYAFDGESLKAQQLTQFHDGFKLGMTMFDPLNSCEIYYDSRNISSLNWNTMIDLLGLTLSLAPEYPTLYSSQLRLKYPPNRLFVLYRQEKGFLPEYQISHTAPGNGLETKANYVSMDNHSHTYQVRHSKLLPPPYASMCYNYPTSVESCLNRCLRETNYQMNKKLHYTAQTVLDDTRDISNGKTVNDTQVQQTCIKVCNKPNCETFAFQRSSQPRKARDRKNLAELRGHVSMQFLGYDLSEWFLFTMYTLLSFAALLGNSVIFSVIMRDKKISNTYKLIVNQCVTDTICGLIYNPSWVLCSSWAVALGNGTGGVICESFAVIQVGTFFVSAYNMAVIAFDRYLKLYYPASKGLKASRYVPLTWIFGLVAGVFNSFHFQFFEFFTPYRLVGCRKSFPINVEFFGKRYNYLLVFFLTNGSLALVAFAYYKVMKKIRERKTIGELSRARSYHHEEAKMRTTYMLMTTVAAYISLCGPLFLSYAIDHYIVRLMPECTTATVFPVWFLVIFFLAISSTAVNPIIFCYFNLEIRKQFKAVVKQLCGLESRGEEDKSPQAKIHSLYFHSNTNATSLAA